MSSARFIKIYTKPWYRRKVYLYTSKPSASSQHYITWREGFAAFCSLYDHIISHSECVLWWRKYVWRTLPNKKVYLRICHSIRLYRLMQYVCVCAYDISYYFAGNKLTNSHILIFIIQPCGGFWIAFTLLPNPKPRDAFISLKSL